MDVVSLTYYAIVCGLLAGFVPATWRMPLRFGLGVFIGIVAAGVLPMLRGVF
ncbi:hypothetical protein KUV47_20100 [Vannielia litorea]|uniref:hypothetical protein n=1 Tax=Vannielia TaxID=2813041 RepID=UPI001C988F36|nr:hypothetical protein [Vannielia litorea]MBY6049812.1 hypothetical protein [Vannielia litorea]MBY6077226.1 hypothetical protein [Vannielia litorea]MBY6155532.1 hypothetical protein [Vannielia litorea]